LRASHVLAGWHGHGDKSGGDKSGGDKSGGDKSGGAVVFHITGLSWANLVL
jgi:hypothetical protein